VISTFLHRPWFRRRWIVQEAALGHDNTVHCGHLKIAWHWLVDGLEAMKTASEQGNRFDRKALDALNNAYAIRTNTGKSLDFSGTSMPVNVLIQTVDCLLSTVWRRMSGPRYNSLWNHEVSFVFRSITLVIGLIHIVVLHRIVAL
jgi:hypothetical protein